MGKLVMWNVVTVDGYFEGQKAWELPWHEPIWSEDLERLSLDQLSGAAGLIFGRVTYEGMADYWSKESGAIAEYMNSLPKFVVSTSLKTATWNNSTIVKTNVAAELEQLKAAHKKDFYVFGSSKLLQYLIRHDLVDEYRIGIAPHIHGSGALLFKPGLPERDLVLLEVRKVRNDGVILFYAPKNRAPANPSPALSEGA